MTTAPNLHSEKIILENFKTVDNFDKNHDFKKNGDLFENFLVQAERNASARVKKNLEFTPLSPTVPTPKLSTFKNSIKSPLKTQTTQATQANDNTMPSLPPKPTKINTIGN